MSMSMSMSIERVREALAQGARLQRNSRSVRQGDVFVALPGIGAHGRAYLSDAHARGACCAVLDAELSGADVTADVSTARALPDFPVLYWPELDTAPQAFLNAALPLRHEIPLVGVTGTDGKSSVASLCAQLLSESTPAWLLGTVGAGPWDDLQAGLNTTPDRVQLQHWLHDANGAHAAAAVMEVSSHALVQQRVQGMVYDCAVFTNLGRDHLDYHGSVEAYREAKWQLFAPERCRHAIVNIDDAVGASLVQSLRDRGQSVTTVSAAQHGDLRYKIMHAGDAGQTLQWFWQGQQYDSHIPFLGAFNASNAALALAVALHERDGKEIDELLSRLARAQAVPGRMERFRGQGLQVIVDFAHTPQALETVLRAIRPHVQRELWCVFGCGGDRDRGKRAEMGRVAEALSERVVVTDDNPRSEASAAIFADIRTGLIDPDAVQWLSSREQATRYALEHAQVGDCVLIAGKGHENTQTVGNEVRHYSDRETVQRLLQEAACATH